MIHNTPYGLYIHWPFCLSKCPYCDFNSHVADNIDHQQWSAAFISELDFWCKKTSVTHINSLFFGGGTPSLMSPTTVDNIISYLHINSLISNACEITLEANPTSVEAQKLANFKSAGINRVSIGVQAFDNEALHFLGREHSKDEALTAISTAAQLFDNYSFDLIYGRPNQTVKSWEAELQQALTFAPYHLSLYQLTIEKGTPFYSQHQKGNFTMPDNNLMADFYDCTNKLMANSNFNHYEISNYAKPGFESQHNLTYWKYRPYIGIGPGAHGRVIGGNNVQATMNIHQPDKWLHHVENNKNGLQQNTTLSNDIINEEMIMMGLRSNSGLNLHYLNQLTGTTIKQECLQPLIDEQLITIEDSIIIPTTKGMAINHQLVHYFYQQIND